MSEEFEVKGPHDEVLEGGEEIGEGRGFNNRLAVMTAIMATIGALLSYEASVSLGEAIISKNDAAMKKTSASDQWSYYQAKGNKQNLAELAVKLTSGRDREESMNEVARYESEKAEIKKQAEEFDKQAQEQNEISERYMHRHHQWATGTTALQIAISLAAIALLTRRQWLQYASLTCGLAGVVLGLCAWYGV